MNRTIAGAVAGALIMGSVLIASGSPKTVLRKEQNKPPRVETRSRGFSETVKVENILKEYGDQKIFYVKRERLVYTCSDAAPQISVQTMCYFVDDIPKLPLNTRNYLRDVDRSKGVRHGTAKISEMFNRDQAVQIIGPLIYDYVGYYDTTSYSDRGLENTVVQDQGALFILPREVK